MVSVRITAAGAVFVCCLSFLTAPARACDDRYFNGCEKAAAAAANEESAAPARRSKRVKVVATRPPHTRLVRRRQAPRFAARLARRAAREETAKIAAPSNTPMARRFRGFINPQPLSQNAFEALRKPRVVSLDFDAAAVLPVVDLAATALPTPPVEAEPAPARSPTATTAKQDRLVAKPVALKPAALMSPGRMELASADSRPVTLAPAPQPAAAVVPVAAAAPAIVTESPPAGPQKSKFSFHGLVLALCGALGAASALRFIVGA